MTRSTRLLLPLLACCLVPAVGHAVQVDLDVPYYQAGAYIGLGTGVTGWNAPGEPEWLDWDSGQINHGDGTENEDCFLTQTHVSHIQNPHTGKEAYQEATNTSIVTLQPAGGTWTGRIDVTLDSFGYLDDPANMERRVSPGELGVSSDANLMAMIEIPAGPSLPALTPVTLDLALVVDTAGWNSTDMMIGLFGEDELLFDEPSQGYSDWQFTVPAGSMLELFVNVRASCQTPEGLNDPPDVQAYSQIELSLWASSDYQPPDDPAIPEPATLLAGLAGVFAVSRYCRRRK